MRTFAINHQKKRLRIMLNLDAKHPNLFEAVRPKTFFCNLLDFGATHQNLKD